LFSRFLDIPGVSFQSRADGVAHQPQSFAMVGKAGVIRSHNSPARIIPHFGKVTEDHGKSSLNKQWAVFHEDVLRSNFTDNSRHVAPHSAALSVDTGSFSCCADVLAGKASRNDINTASP